MIFISAAAGSIAESLMFFLYEDEEIPNDSLCCSLYMAAMLSVSRVNGTRTNTYFCTVVLNETPVPGNFTTFKAAHVEKKKFKPVTRSKISILFRTLGSEVYHLYSGTQYRGKAVVRSLSSLKAFFFSFFLKKHTLSSATSVRPPLLSFPFFFFVFFLVQIM